MVWVILYYIEEMALYNQLQTGIYPLDLVPEDIGKKGGIFPAL